MTSDNHQSEPAWKLSGFVERSYRLQRILIDAGFRKRDGISTEGIRLVSRVAKRERIRDWPNTQTLSDYEALIAAVKNELGNVSDDRQLPAASRPETKSDENSG